MKSRRLLIFAITIAALLLPSALTIASYDDIRDVSEHWAETALRQAYNDELIYGDNGYLRPDAGITTAQVITILCRVLRAEISADLSTYDLPDDVWYYDYAAKAAYLGLLSDISEEDLDANMTRQDAFCMLSEAFQLTEVNPDLAVLEQFADAVLINANNRKALASLVSKGIIIGYEGNLNVNDEITRASFVSVVYRIAGSFLSSSLAEGNFEQGALLHGSAELTGNIITQGIWLDCTSTDVSFEGVSADSVVIRSHFLNSLEIKEETKIERLTIAAQKGDVFVSPEEGSNVSTLVVGSGGGDLTVEGVETIEITGHNRNVTVAGDADYIIISGHDNTITIEEDASVGKLELMLSAAGAAVIVDGHIDELVIMCTDTEISGQGRVSNLRLYSSYSNVSVEFENAIISIDPGLSNAHLKLGATEKVAVNNPLTATASIENAAPGSDCELTWFIDDEEMLKTTITTGGSIPALMHSFEPSPHMPESVEVKVTVSYVTMLGEYQELSANTTVELENYDRFYWMQMETPRVLDIVTLGYLGDFTLEWALENDLDDYDKEVWINAHDYTSTSEYLIWINLAYQRVNIFMRTEDEHWELIRTCIVGTGAPGRGTPPGVWTTSYKQVDGWNTGSYTVKPVVRFRDSSGYAFHSRLYYPGTTAVSDPSIGFPVSLGCVRMYDDDIWFIHDNIPDGTTVVVH